mgnify:CR=1 FL=1
MVWIYFLIFVVLILLEMPIGTAMLLSSLLYVIQNGQSFVMFAQKTATSFASYSLLAVPAFVFVGCAMNEIGFSDRIFGLAEKAIGHIPGGLGHANVLASMIFAGMSGSAMAYGGGIVAIEIKAMNEAGYDKGFSVAITAASSGIGPIIPPSINLVIWGFLASTGTVELFMAGVLPGILMGLCLMVYIYIAVTKFHVKAPITPKAPFKDFLHALWRGLPALSINGILAAGVCFAILLGGISTGVFTSTETGAVACAYIILLGFCYRRLNFAKIMKILKETMSTTALTMWLCATGSVFNWMIINSGITKTLSDLLLSLNNEIIVLLLLNLLLLFLGCFMGSLPVLIMMAPVLLNVADAFSMSYITMGVMAVLNLTIGGITPPMAPSLFVSAKVADLPFEKTLKHIYPMLVPLVVALLMVTFIKPLTLFLPGLLL